MPASALELRGRLFFVICTPYLHCHIDRYSLSSFFFCEYTEAQKPPKVPSAHLHDIEEVDEDPSSRGGQGIAPPTGLTLDRQFVEGDQYSVAITWEVPHPLPEGTTGYNIYVNGELNYDVEGGDKTSVLLTGIPRKRVRSDLGE